MKTKLLKSMRMLLVAVLLGVGASAWGEDIAYNVVTPIDYSVNSAPSWGVTGAGNSVEFADGVCIHYNNTSSGHRTNYLDLMKTDFKEDNWTLKFDAAIKSGSNNDGHGIAIYGTGTTFSTSNGQRRNQDIYNNNVYFALASKENGGTVFSTIIGTTASDDVTLTAGTFYTYTISLTGINENVGTLNITIAPTAGGDAVFSKTVANFDISTLGRFYGIWSRTARHSSSESKTTNGWTKFDNIKLTSTKVVDALNTPTATIYSVDGNNRGVLLSSEYADATIYYSTDNGASFSNCPNNTVLQISATTTYKLYAKVGDMTSETITSSEFVAGVAEPLSPASCVHSGSGVYTITNDQSSVPLSPIATVHYRLGSGAEQTSTATSITVDVTEDAILTYWLTATGYAQTEATNVNVLAPILKNQDYEDLNFCTSNTNEWAVKGDAVAFGSSTYYQYKDQSNNLIGDGVLAVSYNNADSNGRAWRIYRFYGGVGPHYNTETMGLLNLKKGQIVVVEGTPTATNNLTALPAETYTGHYGYYVTADGNASMSFSKGSAVKHIYIYTTPIRNAIDDCKTYETSAAFATYIEGRYDNGDFSTADEVYAAHTAWQIAQADASSSLDYTKVIFNADFGTGSLAPWTIYGDAATGDAISDNDANGVIESNGAGGYQYYTGWNGRNVSQSILGLPAGVYRLSAQIYSWKGGAPVRLFANGSLSASENGESHIINLDFVVTGSEESVKIGVGGIGNDDDTDNTWGTWGYRINYFTLTKIASVSSTLGTNGYGTFASPYALDLANLPAGLTAYKAAVSGTTVTFTPVTEAVQANTGLLLKGDASETYSIPVTISGADISGTNEFMVNTAGTVFNAEDVDADSYYFGLIKNTLTFGVFDPTAVAIPADKAYLKVLKTSIDESPSRALTIKFGDEETGIKSVQGSGVTVNGYYNLSGQRVSQPTKGLYIVNGKKVIIK